MRIIHTRLLLSILIATASVIIIGNFFALTLSPVAHHVSWSFSDSNSVKPPAIPNPTDDPHPIIHLVTNAETEFNRFLSQETHDLASAAWLYRERRGRHPPPGFDKWHRYAQDNDAIIVEEFWDQIYHDLIPLWALDQKEMRANIKAQKDIFQIREGAVTSNSDHFWAKIWKELVEAISTNLPDLDMAVNCMDEPRLFIPWKDINSYVETERKSRKVLDASNVISEYGNYSLDDDKIIAENVEWEGGWPLLERARNSCYPESLVHNATLQTDFSKPPILSTELMAPHSYKGFVSNYTLSTSICHQPDLQGLHGFFIEPVSIRASSQLFPLFGGSKLSINSEILLPPTMYYKGDSRFTSDEHSVPWSQKSDSIVWRGLASGGRNKADNWKGFHRHRLVSMLNGTQALLMPNNSGYIDIQELPLESWDLGAFKNTSVPRNQAMGDWLNTFSDVSFTDLACFPEEEGSGCSYTDHLFATKKRMSLHEQHSHKYLVDVDGNSFSGRYHDFLLSNSLPIKATLFREWHDSRLIAWKHFIPFDNRFLDLYGIMEFFLGYGSGKARKEGRDQLAHRISTQGQEWAMKVLRREDMRIYTYRLLLEYARVMDDNRDTLGWVDDILDDNNTTVSKG